MLLTFLQNFSFIPRDEMIFEYLFANLSFRLPWQQSKFRGLDKIHIFCRGLFKEHLCKTFVKICNEIAIKAYFHISHYKSMETLSCHSIESTLAIAIKTIFIETNVMNISAKFQVHSPYGFSGKDF